MLKESTKMTVTRTSNGQTVPLNRHLDISLPTEHPAVFGAVKSPTTL